MAEWLRRQGHRVIRTASSYWFDQGPHVYQAFPYHWVIEPGGRELAQFLLGHLAIGLRFSTPLTAPHGAYSYHAVHEDGPYTMATLPRRARTAVRKGLRNTTVEPIPLERLATEGWELRAQTLERQGRTGAETADWWAGMCRSAEGLPGFEAWGALLRGRLVAAILAVTCDDCYTLLYQQSATEYLHYGSNNALAYMVTHEVMARPGIKRVFYGLHSLDAPLDVDTFKLRMGYTAKPLRQRVVFNPLLAPCFNRASHNLIRRLLDRRPDNTFLAKTEGMIRFYLQGRLPLEQQPVPPALAGTAPPDTEEEPED